MSHKAKKKQHACFQAYINMQGSTTILNHVDGSRNHLNLLLELRDQVEILESGIMISTFILGYLINTFPCIMNHMMHEPLFDKQESHNQAEIPESYWQKFNIADPLGLRNHYSELFTQKAVLKF